MNDSQIKSYIDGVITHLEAFAETTSCEQEIMDACVQLKDCSGKLQQHVENDLVQRMAELRVHGL